MSDCLFQDMESILLGRRHHHMLFKSSTSRLRGGRGQVCFELCHFVTQFTLMDCPAKSASVNSLYIFLCIKS